MQNRSLALDYITRCQKRLKAIDTLFVEKSWPDVVRESQEVVELSLKALLKFSNVEVPRVHDVSNILDEEKARLPKAVQADLTEYMRISRDLRRDRELAFYGSEDLTPSEFYKIEDAESARQRARWVVETLAKVILE
jgi:HEPN domain-containing protein